MPFDAKSFSRNKKKADEFVLEKPFHFYVDKEGCFSPRRIPSSGSLVALETCTKSGGNVIIADDWVVDGVILPMSVITIWSNATQYTYQVVPSGRRDFGTLSLISKTNTLRQPGVHTRTNRTGGSKSNYSR